MIKEVDSDQREAIDQVGAIVIAAVGVGDLLSASGDPAAAKAAIDGVEQDGKITVSFDTSIGDTGSEYASEKPQGAGFD